MPATVQTSRASAPPSSRFALRRSLPLAAAFAVLLSLAAGSAAAQRQTIPTRTQETITTAEVLDAGALAGSTPLTLTLRLAPSRAKDAALTQLLADQLDPSSPRYRQWLTPSEFAARFGASEQELDRLNAWLLAEGVTVNSLSPAHTRMAISGPASLVQTAFDVSLRQMNAGGSLYFANTTQPSVPVELGDLVGGIDGLDDLPSTLSARIGLTSPVVTAVPAAHTQDVSSTMQGASRAEFMTQLAEAIDANQSPVLTLDSTACAPELSESEIADIRALFRQADAQGITLIATSNCGASSPPSLASARLPAFPSALSEVTAITLPTSTLLPATSGVEARPVWQAAPGLPADALRHEPDLTTTSVAAFAQTVAALKEKSGSRVGNLAATLYALAKTPGLFTQPGTASSSAASDAAGNWQPATGLGTINLATLLKVYPRGTGVISTTTGVQSSSYAVNYGDSFTLTGKVIPVSYGQSNPTGTVTFNASSQGALGSATIDAGGNATLTPDILPAGTYSISAVYSGDGNYSGSASTIKATVTISSVTAKITASLAPATNVPYGATATVTATVALPGANAGPSGPVSAQIEGITGAFYSATLSPNPGGNTATANIVLSAPPPGTYEIDVTCQGSTNFQCQTPAPLPFKTVKGYTNTTVSVTPAAPQAGQPISLTATVANAGNGTGSYTYNGSVSFYDSGKLLATAPVATNQATTTLALSGNRTHNITAVYTGDANWSTSTSGAVAVTPTILPDGLSLSSNVSGSSSLAGVNIIFTGTITTEITYGTGPTGTITFFDTFNGAVVQLGNPAVLVANGPTASIGIFTTTGLLAGTHHIYAQYGGDSNYAATISPVLDLSLSDFGISMTPTSLSIAQGKSQQVAVFVGSSGGFSGAVSLGCTPPSSSQATCSFAPASVTTSGATTLTITTAAATASARPAAPRAGLWTLTASTTVSGLALLLLPARRRALPSLLALSIAVALLSASLGCGLGITPRPGQDQAPGAMAVLPAMPVLLSARRTSSSPPPARMAPTPSATPTSTRSPFNNRRQVVENNGSNSATFSPGCCLMTQESPLRLVASRVCRLIGLPSFKT